MKWQEKKTALMQQPGMWCNRQQDSWNPNAPLVTDKTVKKMKRRRKRGDITKKVTETLGCEKQSCDLTSPSSPRRSLLILECLCTVIVVKLRSQMVLLVFHYRCCCFSPPWIQLRSYLFSSFPASLQRNVITQLSVSHLGNREEKKKEHTHILCCSWHDWLLFHAWIDWSQKPPPSGHLASIWFPTRTWLGAGIQIFDSVEQILPSLLPRSYFCFLGFVFPFLLYEIPLPPPPFFFHSTLGSNWPHLENSSSLASRSSSSSSSSSSSPWVTPCPSKHSKHYLVHFHKHPFTGALVNSDLTLLFFKTRLHQKEFDFWKTWMYIHSSATPGWPLDASIFFSHH